MAAEAGVHLTATGQSKRTSITLCLIVHELTGTTSADLTLTQVHSTTRALAKKQLDGSRCCRALCDSTYRSRFVAHEPTAKTVHPSTIFHVQSASESFNKVLKKNKTKSDSNFKPTRHSAEPEVSHYAFAELHCCLALPALPRFLPHPVVR